MPTTEQKRPAGLLCVICCNIAIVAIVVIDRGWALFFIYTKLACFNRINAAFFVVIFLYVTVVIFPCGRDTRC